MSAPSRVDPPVHTEVSRLVAGSIRATVERREAIRVGLFAILYDASSANVWRNYAVPDDGAEPSAAHVAALIAAFVDLDRTPRLEYVPAAAPAVEAMLVSAGFVVEGRPPLMACRPGDLTAPLPVDGVTVALITDAADLLDVINAQNDAYGEPEPAGPDDVARLRGAIERGSVVALARDAATGQAVGGGICGEPVDGVSELAAVGVRASHRRRGIATAITRLLTESGHANGAHLVWLEPAGEREALVYARAGFQASGQKLWISRPTNGAGPRH
jgi:ribosomal protein S18 acetylase RimI-like enzyme